MKQSKRIISVLLAMVMLFAAIPMSAYAAHAPYTQAGGYNLLDNPYITPEQAASMLLDQVDAMLAENDMTVPIDIYVGSRTIDLRSIDKATTSITHFWAWTWKDIAFGILNFGDIERMNMYWIQRCPLRTSPGQSDLDVVLALCRFLKDNYERIGKIIDNSFNYGFVKTVTDLPPELDDIPGTIKTTVLKALNDGEEPPAGTTVDALVQNMIDELLVGVYNADTGKYEGGILPSMAGKTNLGTSTVYTFITDAINAAMVDVAVPMLSRLLLELAGVEFSDEFPGGDDSNLGDLAMIIDMITGNAEIIYEPEDLLTPLSRMSCALRYYLLGGGLDEFIWLDDTGLHVSDQLTEMIDGLVRVALSLMPGLGFLTQTKEFKTEEEVMAMSMMECYAYLARLLINEFLPFADIPDTCTTLREVVTYLLIGIAKDVLPEFDFELMIENYQLNPATDGVFIVAAPIIRYYLNGLLPIDIPVGLDFVQTLDFIVSWFFDTYGGFFYTDGFLPSDTVWNKIDKVIFNIIPINWLPAQFTGSEYMVMDWLLGNILDFDYVGLMSIVQRNPSSELNLPITRVLLNTVSRFLRGALGNNTILPMNIPSLEAVFTKPNFRALIQNLSLRLADHGNELLGTLFPLVTNVLGIWNKETYIRKAPSGAPLVGIEALQNLLDSYTPTNPEGMDYTDPDYYHFGEEDFSELRNYFNYRQAMREVQALLDEYKRDPETLDLQKNTDAAYRVTFYFNRTQLRSTVVHQQLTKEIQKAYYADYQQEDYTAKSWAAYQKAYNFAMDVRTEAILNTSGTMRQSKITTARHQLLAAIRGLSPFVPYADYFQLDWYIQQAETQLATMNHEDFTSESIEALIDALNAAKAIDRFISGEDQVLVDDVAAALYNAIYGLTYILEPGIVPIPDSSYDMYGNPLTPIVNNIRRFVYGLPEGGLRGSFLNSIGGASTNIIPTAQGFGTGTRVRLVFNSIVISTYTVVVFGDVNGDGNIDGGDSGMIVDYANYLYNWTPNPDKRFAGDVNGDGNIDDVDADIVTECLNWMMGIDQLTGLYYVA